jgi:transcriptional regulator with XRE-family HTH domain
MSRSTHELRLLREALGIPAYQVSEATGIHPARLSKIERGLAEPTKRETDLVLQALGPAAPRGFSAASRLLRVVCAPLPPSSIAKPPRQRGGTPQGAV